MKTLHALAWTALAVLLCGSRPVWGAEGPPQETRRGSVLAAHQIDSLGLGPLRVGIDIVPEKKQNLVQPGRWDFLPVAILGSPGFDVLNVDRESLVFGPSAAHPSNGRSWRVRDVNGDGHTDLLVFYRTRETGIVEGDSRACLAGATVSGTRFEGCDSVETATRKRARAKRE